MTIRVKYFASLREQLGRAEDVLEAGDARTVTEIWTAVTGESALPPNTLAAVNAEYVDAAERVADGDEVAFFPPVTGG